MPKFNEPLAQAEYERLMSTGMSAEDAHQEVEIKRMAGQYTPPEARTRPRIFSIVGSSDQKRIARKRGMQEMADNDPDKFDQYKRQAEAAGVDITGKSYQSGFAAYPGDPEGWCGDDNDIAAKARMKGFKVSKEDGILKLGVPMDISKDPREQMMAKKRLTKPVKKRRRMIQRTKGNRFKTKAGSWSRGI